MGSHLLFPRRRWNEGSKRQLLKSYNTIFPHAFLSATQEDLKGFHPVNGPEWSYRPMAKPFPGHVLNDPTRTANIRGLAKFIASPSIRTFDIRKSPTLL